MHFPYARLAAVGPSDWIVLMLTLIPLCLPYDCVAQRLDRSNANIDSIMPALRLCGPEIGLF